MKRLISLALAAVLALSLAACSGNKDTPTATPSASPTATPESTPTPPAADTNPLTMLTQGHYVYSFYAEGYGSYTFFLHFYPEAPVLGAVFYAGYANNGVKFAGTYTVEKKDKEYAVFPDRDAAVVPDGVPPSGIAPYTITFFDFDGNEIESCGYDGDFLYNDLATIAGSGSGPLKYAHDIAEDSEFNDSYDGEIGVKYLEFVSPDDDTATITLSHNQTYTDLIGTMIEGAWSMEKSSDGYTYTLKPDDATDTGAKLAVAADKKTAVYTPDGGTAVNLITTASDAAGSGEITELFAFTGGFTTLSIYSDSTYKFAFESSNVEETGTWTFDKTTFVFELTQENGNVIPSTIDGDSHAMTLHYTAVINEQLQDDFSAGSSAWSVLTTFNASTAKELFAFTGGFTTLSILEDGTYVFAFESHSVRETGTWAFDKAAYQFSLTQESGNVITSEIDADSHVMKIYFTAVISRALIDTFTAEPSVWSVLTTFEPSASASEELFAFTGGFTTLTLYTDNSYTFAFESSNVEEKGAWAFDKATYQFTLTQENGNVITGAIDGDSHALTLHYTAVINEQLQDDFTVGSEVWGPALTQ